MPVGILLAAGASQRFGADKRLHPLADGRPMLAHSITHAAAALPAVWVVIREDEQAVCEQVSAALTDPVLEKTHWLPARESCLGMGSSLAAGVRATADADGWIVLLGDMPAIAPSTICVVAEALQHSPLVRPSCDGRAGHPVAFSPAFAEDLLALQGDQGARAILDKNQQRLLLLSVADPGVWQDVDSAADLIRLTGNDARQERQA
ncbi:MAG: nucleotidyltransferase family protein [Gammaproteobacteria bacterium]|nr:MAG: nucleotidyltransferase family protein [Gammaproteobacteria bacterium]